MNFLIRKIVFAGIFVLILLVFIAIGRGYRFSISHPSSLKPTGIIVASSFPTGSRVYINGKFEGATNTNISLDPGKYEIEIKKDGYMPWKKTVNLKGELVLKADVLLFPLNPPLSPVTSLGITKAFTSTSGDKIVIISDTNNVEKDGIYLFENVRNPISRINPLKLLALKSAFPTSITDGHFSDVDVTFSPDEGQMLVKFAALPSDSATTTKSRKVPATPQTLGIYLMDTNTQVTKPFNVTESDEPIRQAWDQDHEMLMKKAFAAFKKPLAKTASNTFDVISFSPDERKMIYTASASAQIPLVINPPLIAANQTPETRNLDTTGIYVYDQEEDKNFRILSVDDFDSTASARSSILWYPDSAHIVVKGDKAIDVMDYDGTNRRTVYAGPFLNSFLTVSKDGKLFILANFNATGSTVFDMYSVGLK